MASYGTTYRDNSGKTIGAVESQFKENFPDWDIRRAFTSRFVIKLLEQRYGEKVDYITGALDKLIDDGVKTVIIQPTLIMNGKEYDFIKESVSLYRDRFDSFTLGRPLLTKIEDYDRVVDFIASSLLIEAKKIAGDRTAVILMGHGAEHHANSSYSQLYLKLLLSGYPDVFVTTVEGFPDYEDTIALMKGSNYKDVVLFPFMFVAGDHANNDLAGDDKNSLKPILEEYGYKVHCVVKGLGEYKEFRDLFITYAEEIIKSS